MMPAIEAGLLERAREQGALDSVIAGATEGRGLAALITGPAGIGKTALLDHARSRAADRGLAILAARGGELEH